MKDKDLLTFLARTNPFMFLLLGALLRGRDDDRYQELLQSGPYGIGRYGYLFALIGLLVLLLLAIVIMASTGRLPTHSGPGFP